MTAKTARRIVHLNKVISRFTANSPVVTVMHEIPTTNGICDECDRMAPCGCK